MEDVREYTLDDLAKLVPVPDRRANKYTRGCLVVVAGCAQYPGAACLAACAGQRAGAGYTEVFCAPEAVDVVRACRSSLVVRSWASISAVPVFQSTPEKPVACVVGPGFAAEDEECARLTHWVLEHIQAPVLVDGGALDALATVQGRALLARRVEHGLPVVVTPHGGEAARLARPLNLPMGDQGELARRIANAYQVVAVVKGSDTFVSDGEEVVAVRLGTPALAKAGTGDVLAGMLGAFLAQGVAPVDASVLTATLHAQAARLASARLTDVCVVPEDVIEALPGAVAALLARA